MLYQSGGAEKNSRLNALDGVAAKVNLKKRVAIVSIDRDVSNEEIKKTVENAGYQVIDIR